MRARPLALIIAGLLASTSAIGIALYNSQQQLPEQARSEVDTGSNLNADDTATLEAAGESLDLLPVGESFQYGAQAFDTTRDARDFSTPELAWLTLEPQSLGATLPPTSIDMGHSHGGAVASNGSPGVTSWLQASALSAGLSTRFGGASARGGGGGGGGGGGASPNPGGGTGVVDAPTGKGNDIAPPKVPETPKTPDTPDTPDTPAAPETPSTPDTHFPPYEPPVIPDPEVPGSGTPGSGVGTPVSVPEPGTLGLLGVALIGLVLGRRKVARRS